MQSVAAAPKKVVRKIPAKINIAEEIKQAHRQLRVAAYCRVSTAQEEQLNSYTGQEKSKCTICIFAIRGHGSWKSRPHLRL